MRTRFFNTEHSRPARPGPAFGKKDSNLYKSTTCEISFLRGHRGSTHVHPRSDKYTNFEGPTLDAQITLPHGTVVVERLRRSLPGHAALLHDHVAVRNAQQALHVLVDDDHRVAGGTQL